jgi:hypothetical protein
VCVCVCVFVCDVDLVMTYKKLDWTP